MGGGLEEKGREGIVLFAEYTMMVIFFEIGGELNGKCWCAARPHAQPEPGQPDARRLRRGAGGRDRIGAYLGRVPRRYQPGDWTTWSIAIEKARARSRLRPLVGEK